MSLLSQPLAICGITPKTRECCLIARQHPEDVMQALADGLIVVPVTAEKARWAFHEVISDIYALVVTDDERERV
jgi:hypothetical protein